MSLNVESAQIYEETDVAFAIRKGVKNTNMRYLPKLLSAQVCLAHKHFSNMVHR